MARVNTIDTIIEYSTDHKGGTVGGHAHRMSKLITTCFTINVQSNLGIRIDSRVELVHSNMTKKSTIDTIV
jgi:hypothetical protein